MLLYCMVRVVCTDSFMSDSGFTVRFAPSPTGFLHIGNLRTALYNWLFCKCGGGFGGTSSPEGLFILRLDDTDIVRSRVEFSDSIISDLDWLGLSYDRLECQSGRIELYDTAADRLRDMGLLYACYESEAEIARRRKRLMARGLPPIYDRSALRLTDSEKSVLESEGRVPHWRFLLPNFDSSPFATRRSEVCWRDVILGDQVVDLSSLSDPVLVRADGSYLYTLPSVVDDIDMGVSHIIRGGDHITNTGVQVSLFEALGGSVPSFGHHNLLTDSSGEGLSKRNSSLSICSFRESGIEPMALNCLAALLGTGHSVEPHLDLLSLGELLDFRKISRSAAKFGVDDLGNLNERLLHRLDYSAALPRLESLGISDVGEQFWDIVRPNIRLMSDTLIWHSIISDSFTGSLVSSGDREFIAEAREVLLSLDSFDWQSWTDSLRELTGRKGKELFMPLRLALTGLEHGPDMGSLLLLIGKERALSRLSVV